MSERGGDGKIVLSKAPPDTHPPLPIKCVAAMELQKKRLDFSVYGTGSPHVLAPECHENLDHVESTSHICAPEGKRLPLYT